MSLRRDFINFNGIIFSERMERKPSRVQEKGGQMCEKEPRGILAELAKY